MIILKKRWLKRAQCDICGNVGVYFTETGIILACPECGNTGLFSTGDFHALDGFSPKPFYGEWTDSFCLTVNCNNFMIYRYQPAVRHKIIAVLECPKCDYSFVYK